MRYFEAIKVLTSHPLFEQPTKDRDKQLITEALKTALHALRGDFDEEEFWSDDHVIGDRLNLPCSVVYISKSGEVTVKPLVDIVVHRDKTITIKDKGEQE